MLYTSNFLNEMFFFDTGLAPMFGIWNCWSKSKKSQKVCFGHIVVVLGSDRSWFNIDRPHCNQDHAESKPAHAREIKFHTYYSGKNIITYYRPMLNFPRLKREKGNVGCDACIERAEITLPSKKLIKVGGPSLPCKYQNQPCLN